MTGREAYEIYARRWQSLTRIEPVSWYGLGGSQRDSWDAVFEASATPAAAELSALDARTAAYATSIVHEKNDEINALRIQLAAALAPGSLIAPPLELEVTRLKLKLREYGAANENFVEAEKRWKAAALAADRKKWDAESALLLCKSKLEETERALRKAKERIETLSRPRATRITSQPSGFRTVRPCAAISREDIYRQASDPDEPLMLLAENAEQREHIQNVINSGPEIWVPLRETPAGSPGFKFPPRVRKAAR